jgi:hypothetical protein
MKNKKILFILLALFGSVLLLIGIFVLTADSIKTLSGLFIGCGAAMLALGTGNFARLLIVSAITDEEIERIKNIEVNDERNIRIKEKSGYMVAKVMNYVLSAFVLILAFMGADKIIVIMAASLIVIELVLVIIFSNHCAKEM